MAEKRKFKLRFLADDIEKASCLVFGYEVVDERMPERTTLMVDTVSPELEEMIRKYGHLTRVWDSQ